MPAFAADSAFIRCVDLLAEPIGPAESLSIEERERAHGFVFERDRRRYCRARIALRVVLGILLDRPPAEVSIVADSLGKPALADPAGFTFNVSHSGERALIAIGAGTCIGVDLEQVRPITDLLALATTVFDAREVGSIRDAHEADRLGLFLSCWTRKEAVLKALGTGLTVDPRRVHAGTGETIARVDVSHVSPVDALWVHELTLGGNEVAAVASTSRLRNLTIIPAGAAPGTGLPRG